MAFVSREVQSPTNLDKVAKGRSASGTTCLEAQGAPAVGWCVEVLQNGRGLCGFTQFSRMGLMKILRV